MEILDLAKIASALFAGVSVFIAIYTYRRNAEKAHFSSLRRSLVRYRQLITQASEEFDEIGLVEIGNSVAVKLREVCPQSYDTNQIQEFFYNEENANFVRQAIFLGLGASNTLKEAKSIAAKLNELSAEFSEPLPLTRVSLGIMSAYNAAIVNTLSSGDLIDSIFLSVREKSEKYEELPPEELLPPDLVFREMAVYVTLLHVDFTNNYADAMLEQIDKISEIVTLAYERMSDRQLRRTSKLEKKNVAEHLALGNSTPESQKALFEYLKFYKRVLPHDDWDKIVESKTLLEAVALGAESDVED